MRPLTTEWVAKAEGDRAPLLRERRARAAPNYDAACFHAQQCAEKYLKARLHEAGISFGKTHDIERLLDLALPIETSWEPLRADLIALTDFAVEFRYPGSAAVRADMLESARICERVRALVRSSLGM